MRRGFLGALAMLGVAALVLTGLGCTRNDYSRSDTPVFLVVTLNAEGDNEGTGNTIAEWSNVDHLCSDITDITIESRPVAGTIVQSPFTDVDLTTILVWYENIDAAEDEPGITVPYPYTYVVSAEVEVESFTDIFNVPFIQAEAKTAPPLDGSMGLGYPIRLIVHIVVQGNMRSDSSDKVTAELTMQVTVESNGPGPPFPDPDHCS